MVHNDLGDDFGFHLSEGSLSLFSKNFRDRFPRRRFDAPVRIVESHFHFLCQQLANGRLATPAIANQEKNLGLVFAGGLRFLAAGVRVVFGRTCSAFDLVTQHLHIRFGVGEQFKLTRRLKNEHVDPSHRFTARFPRQFNKQRLFWVVNRIKNNHLLIEPLSIKRSVVHIGMHPHRCAVDDHTTFKIGTLRPVNRLTVHRSRQGFGFFIITCTNGDLGSFFEQPKRDRTSHSTGAQ